MMNEDRVKGLQPHAAEAGTFNSDKLRFREHATKSVSRAGSDLRP